MASTVVTQFAAVCTAGEVCVNALPQVGANSSWVQTAITVAIGVVAALSLLFIVIGGFRYILSQGDPGSISKAKGTIMYALIGLAVAILAQTVVIFIVNGVF